MKPILTSILFCTTLAFAADLNIDNDVVKIHIAVDIPHHPSALHRHELNRVMIYLDPGDMELHYQDGRTENQHWKQNQVAWSPAGGMHTSENVGKANVRIIEIELKKPGPPTPPARKPELDPVKIDPKHNILLFENPQVRVFRCWREPGASEMMHEHVGAGRAAVLLTDLDVSIKEQDGSVSKSKAAAGEVMWSNGRIVHAGTNLSAKQFEMIIVEVK